MDKYQLLFVWFVFVHDNNTDIQYVTRAAGQLKILIAINLAIKNFNLS